MHVFVYDLPTPPPSTPGISMRVDTGFTDSPLSSFSSAPPGFVFDAAADYPVSVRLCLPAFSSQWPRLFQLHLKPAGLPRLILRLSAGYRNLKKERKHQGEIRERERSSFSALCRVVFFFFPQSTRASHSVNLALNGRASAL